jgi:hypothetical protein
LTTKAIFHRTENGNHRQKLPFGPICTVHHAFTSIGRHRIPTFWRINAFSNSRSSRVALYLTTETQRDREREREVGLVVDLDLGLWKPWREDLSLFSDGSVCLCCSLSMPRTASISLVSLPKISKMYVYMTICVCGCVFAVESGVRSWMMLFGSVICFDFVSLCGSVLVS